MSLNEANETAPVNASHEVFGMGWVSLVNDFRNAYAYCISPKPWLGSKVNTV